MTERVVRCCEAPTRAYTALYDGRGREWHVTLLTDRAPLTDLPKPHGQMHEALMTPEEQFLR